MPIEIRICFIHFYEIGLKSSLIHVNWAFVALFLTVECKRIGKCVMYIYVLLCDLIEFVSV